MNIAVCSRSFSKNPQLLRKLTNAFPGADLNLNPDQILAGSDLVSFLQECEAAIIGLERINCEILDKLPNIRVLSKYGVGLDNIDSACFQRQTPSILYSAGVNSTSVAELTCLLTLSALRDTNSIMQKLENRSWSQVVGNDLYGKCVLIVGYGAVGKAVAKRMHLGFGADVAVYDIDEQKRICAKADGHSVVDNIQALRPDVITLHCDLNERSRDLIDSDLVAQFKEVILINTCRSEVCVESAIKQGLINGNIKTYCADVMWGEPNRIDTFWFENDRVVLTPHVGGSSTEAILAMGNAAIQNLENFYARAP